MFASIRTYRVESGSVDELLRQIESGLVPELSKVPGYQGHYVIVGDDGSIVSITGVVDRGAIKQLNRVAQTWVHQHLEKFKIRESEVSEGEVRVVHRTASPAHR